MFKIHKDGSVSVGISGAKPSTVNKLQSELDKQYGQGTYRVTSNTLDSSHGVVRGTSKGRQGNLPGKCAEPNCAVTAGGSASEITGSATVWRGVGKNPHPYTGKDKHLFGKDQMDPCPTCAKPTNQSIYQDAATKGSKK